MQQADPFGHFDVKIPATGDASAIRLFVGSSSRFQMNADDYWASAAGWMAVGQRGTQINVEEVPTAVVPAAVLAGAVGAADLFKRAIGHPNNAWLGNIIWCTWQHRLISNPSDSQGPDLPVNINLGNVLVAGVGAIGSALLYVLGMMRATGHITVLDRDSVDTTNLNRSPLFIAQHAADGRRKVDVAFEFLQQVGMDAKPVHGTWREKGDRIAAESFDAWVSLTNEEGAWAEVPYLPPIVVHGTTMSGWGIAFGRHIPGLEDCTACRMPQPHAEFRGPCSQGAVAEDDSQANTVRASLPFLSTIPGALIAAELLKLNYDGAASLPNSVQSDFRLGMPSVVALHLRRNLQCRGCQAWDRGLWSGRGGRSRFAPLSHAHIDEQMDRV